MGALKEKLSFQENEAEKLARLAHTDMIIDCISKFGIEMVSQNLAALGHEKIVEKQECQCDGSLTDIVIHRAEHDVRATAPTFQCAV